MAHNIIVINGRIDKLAKDADSLATLADLKVKANDADAWLKENEENQTEQYDLVHEWLEGVETMLGTVESTVDDCIAGCPL